MGGASFWEAFGPIGQLMVNRIPELEFINGKQPAVTELPPQEARGRLELVFQRFPPLRPPGASLPLFLDEFAHDAHDEGNATGSLARLQRTLARTIKTQPPLNDFGSERTSGDSLSSKGLSSERKQGLTRGPTCASEVHRSSTVRDQRARTASRGRVHLARNEESPPMLNDDEFCKRPPGLGHSIWGYVSRSPLHSLWNLEGVPPTVIARNSWNSLFDDNLLGRAAELGFYFLFALFPTLLSACSILGLAARSATHIYEGLLRYLSVVVPGSALKTVLEIFDQTTRSATSGKLTFGLVAAIWSASVGFSAIQGSLSVVYRVKEERSYWLARLSAIGITIVLSIIVTLILGVMLGSDYVAHLVWRQPINHSIIVIVSLSLRAVAWAIAGALLSFLFALIYYFGPDVKTKRWHWLTPGSAIGIVGWLVASFGLRLYVYLFNDYSATYGSFGTVIILLTWFYLTGLMLLLGGEINSEIEAAVKARQLTSSG
jgi:membrane protein